MRRKRPHTKKQSNRGERTIALRLAPFSLLWEIEPGHIKGNCHAVGAEIINNMEPLDEGPNFDSAMSKKT